MSGQESKVPIGEMFPVSVNPDGTGRYEMRERVDFDDAPLLSAQGDYEAPSPGAAEPSPAINVVVEQSRPGRFMRRAKMVGAIGLVGAVGIAGIQVKQWLDGLGNPFSPKSSHSVELAIEAPETEVYEDVYLNLARVESTFGISLDTSLDRPGPINCDTQTRHTGKEGEDDKITTTTNTGLVIESLAVTRDGDQITAEVSGGITMTDASVDYRDNVIDVRGASGGIDMCVGTNEITWARNILDIAVQETGSVAASCAMQDEAGRKVFESGIRSFIANTDLAGGQSAEELDDMRVEIEDYDVSVDAMYGNSVQGFRQAVDTVIQDYLEETEDGSHKDPEINDRDLLDCSKHDIRVAHEEAPRR